MRLSQLIPAACIGLTIAASAQSPVYFNEAFGKPTEADLAQAVLPVPDGYLVVGSSGYPNLDPWLFKVNLEGQLLWEKMLPVGPYNDYGGEMVMGLDSTYLLISGISRYSSTLKYSGYLLRYDFDSGIAWTKFYTPDTNEYNGIFTMLRSSDGNILMAGSAQRNSAGDSQVFLVKVNEEGDTIWQRLYGTSRWETILDVVETDGGFLLGGYARTMSTGDRDILLIGMNELGEQQWVKYHGGNWNDWGGAITSSVEGGFLVIGHRQTVKGQSWTQDWYRPWMIKVDEIGDIEWEQLLGDDTLTEGSLHGTVIQLLDSSYVAIGGIDQGPQYYALIHRVSPLGKTIWSRTYDRHPDQHDYFWSLEQTPDGGFIICGSTWNTSQDAWLIKLDEHGCNVPGCHLIDGTTEPRVQLYGSIVYPNPTSGVLTIELNRPAVNDAKFTITDMLGKEMFGSVIQAQTTEWQLDMSSYPNGIYLLTLSGESVMHTVKVVKQH